MNNSSSGLLGIGGLLGFIIVLLVAQQLCPQLANVLFLLAVIGIGLIVLLVIVVMYFAFRQPKRSEEQKAKDEIQLMIKAGKKELMTLRRMSMEVKNREIRTLSMEICGIIDKIFRNLNENPDAINTFGQFFNYYLPTIRKILEGYAKLEANTAPAEDVKAHVISCLGDIKAAMIKKRDDMFNNEILDLTVEMEVFTQICKRDGLLPEGGLRKSNQG